MMVRLMWHSILFVLYTGSFCIAMWFVLFVLSIVAGLLHWLLGQDVAKLFAIFRVLATLNAHLGILLACAFALLFSGQPAVVIEKANIFDALSTSWELTAQKRVDVGCWFLMFYTRVQVSVACYVGVVFAVFQLKTVGTIAIILLALPFLITVPLLSM